jgi:large subunit ribosomal protein L24
MRVKKQDVVRVMSGAYKGKQGKVLATMPEKRKCIVEGVNFRMKHQRPLSPENPGGRLKKEGPIHVSNLKIVCPKCSQPTRIGKKSLGDRNVRTCKRCGEMIDE